jgi:DNA-binding transcriptional ArsR family regulator
MDAAVRALAEPNRRAILELVKDTELTAGDIAEQFTITRPAVSQHLKMLEEANLVDVRQDGTRRWYKARPEGLADLRNWVEEFWMESLGELKVVAEQQDWPARARADLEAKRTSRTPKPTS